MTRDEAVAMIKLQLGFRSNQDENIVTCLKTAQVQLELQPTKPWFLVSEDSFKRVTVGEQRVPLPSDFLQEHEDGCLYYVPDDADGPEDHVLLYKDDYDVLKGNFANEASGPPQAYCILGKYFRVFPVPDDQYVIRMTYYKQDTVLSTNVENGWLKYAPFLMMGKAGKMIAGGPLRDAEAMKVFQGWEAEGLLALSGQETARNVTNHSRQVGGPHI